MLKLGKTQKLNEAQFTQRWALDPLPRLPRASCSQQIHVNNGSTTNNKRSKYPCSEIRRSPCYSCWEGSRKWRSVYGSCTGRVLFFVQARHRFDPFHNRVRMLANFNQTLDAFYYNRPGLIAAFDLSTNLCQFDIPFRPFVGKGGLQKQSQH